LSFIGLVGTLLPGFSIIFPPNWANMTFFIPLGVTCFPKGILRRPKTDLNHGIGVVGRRIGTLASAVFYYLGWGYQRPFSKR